MERQYAGLEELLEYGRTLRTGGDSTEITSIALAKLLLRIRDRDGRESPLIANAVQAAFERKRGQRNIIVKARQMGMTTWIAGRFFLRTITARGVLTVLVAHTQDAAESIFRLVQRFWQCLPDHWRAGPLKRSRANVGQMVFPALDSEFRVLSAANENAGRGLTVQYMHLSEVSRWPGDAAATLAGLRAALVPSGELVMESTPNGAHGCFYEEWQHAEEKGTVRHFFPWWLEPAYFAAPVAMEDLREDELALMRGHCLSTAQIGFRRTLESSYRGLRVQEFAEDADLCFRTSGECCFDVEAVERRLGEAKMPLETRRGGALRIWMPPVPGKEYVLAADPAGGSPDGDYSAAQVIDVETGIQCAELQQHIGGLELARVLASLAREYGGALLAVERNNHGTAVLAYLTMVERYTRLYEQPGGAGWLTNAATKPAAIDRIAVQLVDQPWLFLSRTLMEECRTFLRRTNGSSGAAGGAHDDCLMAMAIAQAVRAELLESGPHRRRY